MSSVEMPSLPLAATPRLPRTWYFWGSTVFGLLAHGAMVLAQMLALVVALIRYGGADPEAALKVLVHQGGMIAAATVVACPAMLAVLWTAIRMARRRFASYLALRWSGRSDLLRALGLTFAFLLAWEALMYFSGQTTPASMLDSYRTARQAGLLWLLLIADCLVAPVTEEFAMRGFLFRGWSKSFLGPVGAILLTSAVWTLLHTQYNWFFLVQTFLIGLIFGYWRYRAGSTWLTVIMHGAWNTAVMAQIPLMVTDT
jgi:uncharacterized protein